MPSYISHTEWPSAKVHQPIMEVCHATTINRHTHVKWGHLVVWNMPSIYMNMHIFFMYLFLCQSTLWFIRLKSCVAYMVHEHLHHWFYNIFITGLGSGLVPYWQQDTTWNQCSQSYLETCQKLFNIQIKTSKIQVRIADTFIKLLTPQHHIYHTLCDHQLKCISQ